MAGRRYLTYTSHLTFALHKKGTDVFVLSVQLQVREGYLQEVLQALEVQAEISRLEEPECLRFEVFQDESEATRIHIHELYATRADYEQVHRNTPHFARWSAVADKAVAERTVSGLIPVRLEHSAEALDGEEI